MFWKRYQVLLAWINLGNRRWLDGRSTDRRCVLRHLNGMIDYYLVEPNALTLLYIFNPGAFYICRRHTKTNAPLYFSWRCSSTNSHCLNLPTPPPVAYEHWRIPKKRKKKNHQSDRSPISMAVQKFKWLTIGSSVQLRVEKHGPTKKPRPKKETCPEKETKRTTNLTKFPGWTNDYNDKR